MAKKLVFILVIVTAVGIYLYSRPVPVVSADSRAPEVSKAQAVDLAWPAAGQAAIGAVGYGVLASHGVGKPAPIASIAKIITALAVLKQKPLEAGDSGPQITLSRTDVGYFNYYYLRDGSVANVKAGEKITEYQALQALLLPSANNIGDTLARWAFGSIDAYVAYANTMVENFGLIHTLVGNTNGFSDKTISTAGDLVKLGIYAFKNPVIAQIAGQKTAKIPVEGMIKNVNYLLGTDGIDGIKTGNTDKAGGCYLFAAQKTVTGQKVQLIGAILGQTNLIRALSGAPGLIDSASAGFKPVKLAAKGQMFGSYQTLWGTRADFTVAEDVSPVIWQGQTVKITVDAKTIIAPVKKGASVGTLSIVSAGRTASYPLVLSRNLPGPSWAWRLFHL